MAEEFHSKTVREADRALHQLSLLDDDELLAEADKVRELMGIMEGIQAKLKDLTGKPDQPETAPKPLGGIYLPIIELLPAESPPFILRADWNPLWKPDVMDAVTAANERLERGQHGFVDSEGVIFGPQTLKQRTPGSVRAIVESVAHKCHALHLLDPDVANALDRRE